MNINPANQALPFDVKAELDGQVIKPGAEIKHTIGSSQIIKLTFTDKTGNPIDPFKALGNPRPHIFVKAKQTYTLPHQWNPRDGITEHTIYSVKNINPKKEGKDQKSRNVYELDLEPFFTRTFLISDRPLSGKKYRVDAQRASMYADKGPFRDVEHLKTDKKGNPVDHLVFRKAIKVELMVKHGKEVLTYRKVFRHTKEALIPLFDINALPPKEEVIQ